jgi:chromatin assembly factor 1 subunit A
LKSEEAQKEKLKLLGEEFEKEIKKKTERIKPRLVGCIWIPNNVTNPENGNI